MSNVDNKLRYILEDWYPGTQYSDVIPQIKQAFSEAGYINGIDYADWLTRRQRIPEGLRGYMDFVAKNKGLKVPPRLMTGQEWYDRFEKEYRKLGGYPDDVNINSNAMEAARKASGVDDE